MPTTEQPTTEQPTTEQPTTEQPTTEHVVAVIDDPTGEETALQLARDTVRRGGTATVVLALTSRARRGIRHLARQQGISAVEAEQFYLDRIRETVRDVVGGDIAIVTRRSLRVHSVLETAIATRATAIAIPAIVAGRRGWGHALSTVPIPVTVTPPRAA